MNLAKSILQGLLLVVGIWLATECAITVHYARQRSVYIFDKLNVVLRESSQTMDEVRKAATVWEKSSTEQASKTTMAMSAVGVAASRLSTFVSRTDASVNSRLLPALTLSIQQQNVSLLESQKILQKSLSEVSTATSQAQKVLIDVDKQVSSPDIQLTLDNIAESSAHLATATREGAASMTDVHTALDYELKQLMAPVTKLKVAGNIALNVIRHLYF